MQMQIQIQIQIQTQTQIQINDNNDYYDRATGTAAPHTGRSAGSLQKMMRLSSTGNYHEK